MGIAEAVAAQAGEVKAADVGPAWVGLAAQRFAEHRDQLPPPPPILDTAAGRYQRGADALRRYAGDLEDAQAPAAEALRRAREAEGDIAAAERGQVAMDDHATDATAEAECRNTDHGPSDVSIFDYRWRWIEEDMYPRYLDLVHDGHLPCRKPSLLTQDVGQRAPRRVLHDHHQAVVVVDHLQHPDDMGVVELGEDLGLITQTGHLACPDPGT